MRPKKATTPCLQRAAAKLGGVSYVKSNPQERAKFFSPGCGLDRVLRKFSPSKENTFFYSTSDYFKAAKLDIAKKIIMKRSEVVEAIHRRDGVAGNGANRQSEDAFKNEVEGDQSSQRLLENGNSSPLSTALPTTWLFTRLSFWHTEQNPNPEGVPQSPHFVAPQMVASSASLGLAYEKF